jgi:hypothetical protein
MKYLIILCSVLSSLALATEVRMIQDGSYSKLLKNYDAGTEPTEADVKELLSMNHYEGRAYLAEYPKFPARTLLLSDRIKGKLTLTTKFLANRDNRLFRQSEFERKALKPEDLAPGFEQQQATQIAESSDAVREDKSIGSNSLSSHIGYRFRKFGKRYFIAKTFAIDSSGKVLEGSTPISVVYFISKAGTWTDQWLWESKSAAYVSKTYPDGAVYQDVRGAGNGPDVFTRPKPIALSSRDSVPYFEYQDAYLACFKELSTQIASQISSVGEGNCSAHNSNWATKRWAEWDRSFEPYYTDATCDFGSIKVSTLERDNEGIADAELIVTIEPSNPGNTDQTKIMLLAHYFPTVHYHFNPDPTTYDRLGVPSKADLDSGTLSHIKPKWESIYPPLNKVRFSNVHGGWADIYANFAKFLICLRDEGIISPSTPLPEP